MLVTKRLDLPLLEQELAAAGIVVSALGTFTVDPGVSVELHTYDSAGLPAELPPAASPIVAAHVAPPRLVEHVRTIAVDAVIRTTDATLTEVFRLPTAPKQLYRGTFSMLAVDAVSGDSKDVEARLAFRQQAGAAAQVGATVILSQIQVAASSGWAIQGGAEGADFLVSVRGAAGRTIDWALTGQIAVFAPDGLT